jgi:hypothetical protein
MEIKGLTFLAAEPPPSLTASLEKQSVRAILNGSVPTFYYHSATIGTFLDWREHNAQSGLMKELWSSEEGKSFAVPCVNDKGQFEGTVTISNFFSVLEATVKGVQLDYQMVEDAEYSSKWNLETSQALVEQLARLPRSTPLPLRLLLDTSAIALQDSTSVHRAYSVFRMVGMRYMVIVDGGNRVVGMLSRSDFADSIHHDTHLEQEPAADKKTTSRSPAQVAPTTGSTNRQALLPADSLGGGR